MDIGGTNARVAVIEAAGGRIVAVQKKPLHDHSPAAVVGVVAKLVAAVSQGRALEATPVGVGFAGMLRGSVVLNAPNLGWREVDFGGLLEAALGRKVRLVNDLAAAAWGEHACGAAKGAGDTFTVFVGTGVGSAIISHGALVTGATGVAGEFGHIKVVAEGGRRCGCGQLGCLEAYMGGANLGAWMREVGLTGLPAELERLAAQGEPEARRLYDFAVGHLAVAIANQVTVLNPAVVVLGGGVLSHCPGMVQRVKDAIVQHTSGPAQRGLTVALATLGDDSGIVGAALLAAV